MRWAIAFSLLAILVDAAPALCAADLAKDPGASIGDRQLKCPANLPVGMPKDFAILLEVAEVINTHVAADQFTSLQDILQKYGLWSRGRVLEVRVVFDSHGGVSRVRIDLRPFPSPGERRETFAIVRHPKTGEIFSVSQCNVFWDGNAEIDVRSGKIVAYREGYIEFNPESGRIAELGYIGLQVEWSPEGEIVREERLETRRPLVLVPGKEWPSAPP